MIQRELEGEIESWLGYPILKCPLDLWVYQEIIFQSEPTLIVETGTFKGGSALYFSHLFDLMRREGRIISIDIATQDNLPKHDRITYHTASSIDSSTIEFLKSRIRENDRIMVILDSDHHYDHVLKELQLYSPLVTKGLYLIVEDTNVSGNPVFDPRYDQGPMEAVLEFMKGDPPFTIDKKREKHLLTYNPKGYLLRTE
jgi:cephalosporin hydroxylase